MRLTNLNNPIQDEQSTDSPGSSTGQVDLGPLPSSVQENSFIAPATETNGETTNELSTNEFGLGQSSEIETQAVVGTPDQPTWLNYVLDNPTLLIWLTPLLLIPFVLLALRPSKEVDLVEKHEEEELEPQREFKKVDKFQITNTVINREEFDRSLDEFDELFQPRESVRYPIQGQSDFGFDKDSDEGDLANPLVSQFTFKKEDAFDDDESSEGEFQKIENTKGAKSPTIDLDLGSGDDFNFSSETEDQGEAVANDAKLLADSDAKMNLGVGEGLGQTIDEAEFEIADIAISQSANSPSTNRVDAVKNSPVKDPQYTEAERSEILSALELAESQLADLESNRQSQLESQLESLKSGFESQFQAQRSELELAKQVELDALKDALKSEHELYLEDRLAQLEQTKCGEIELLKGDFDRQVTELESLQDKVSSLTAEKQAEIERLSGHVDELVNQKQAELEVLRIELETVSETTQAELDLRNSQISELNDLNLSLDTELASSREELIEMARKAAEEQEDFRSKKGKYSKFRFSAENLSEADPGMFQQFRRRLKIEYRKRKDAQEFLKQAETQRDEMAIELRKSKLEINEIQTLISAHRENA